ncbi:hypothetical protein BJX68DRAFT_247888 [Aspergillus pseudodeflectus]|uniref:Uncharacterized protein n=1 Tax=Aspergillus pseudodeflectus TaxID=176178 RepID=A0ABR4JIA4_9EURO
MGALSTIYRLVALPLLTTWTLTALSFAALDVVNTRRSLIEPIASISLLTYLVCRLLVVSQPTPQNENERSIAHILTTAHLRSPLNGLISLLFAISWLYELLFKAVWLFFVTVLGGAFATALYTDAFVQTDDGSTESESMYDDSTEAETTALAEFDEIRAKTGVDPGAVIKMIPPRLLVYVVVLVWLNFATLGVYILRHAWRSLRVVFGASREEVVQDIKKVTAAAASENVQVEVEKST